MNQAVCDASILFKLVVVEPDSAQATNLVRSTRVIVPEFVLLEVGNALWLRIRRGSIDVAEAARLLEHVRGLGFETRPIWPLVTRALTIAGTIGHPIYDCLYLALSESLNIPLVTADRRFLDAVRRAGLTTVEVRSLADVA